MGMLDGHVVIVTGGAGGIGSAYCRGLATEGASLVVADLVDPSKVVAEAEELGARAIPVEVDVRDVASTEAMAAAAVDAFGRIDALVNNAAFYLSVTQGPMEEISPEEWDLCFAVNVKGSWLCARAVAPTMRAQKSGKIVNIASMTVNDGTPGFLHYVSSKAAIWGLTRSMARELGDDGISVNTLTPDYIPHDEAYASKQPHVDGLITARRAFKRTQVPDDMVGTLLYLVSPWSDFVTGQNIWVNGGSGFH
jgi:3-oxoacyl-[acyl-carrier protein] reductase